MATGAHIYMSAITEEESDSASESKIKGESTDFFYEDDIVLEGWDWDLARKKTPTMFQDEESGQNIYCGASGGLFKFSKLLDTATTELLSYLRTGELLPLVEVNMMQHVSSDYQTGADFGLTVTLNQVQVVGYDLNATGEFEMSFGEDWTFEYQSVSFDYRGRVGARTWTYDDTSKKDASTEGSGDSNAVLYRIPDADEKDKKAKKDGTAAAGSSRGSSQGGTSRTGGDGNDVDSIFHDSRLGHQGEGVTPSRRNG